MKSLVNKKLHWRGNMAFSGPGNSESFGNFFDLFMHLKSHGENYWNCYQFWKYFSIFFVILKFIPVRGGLACVDEFFQ